MLAQATSGVTAQLDLFLKQHAVIISLISIALGLVNVFFGYKFFKFILGIVGLITGFLAGAAIAYLIAPKDQNVMLLLGAVGGVVGGVFMFMFYKFGIFILGCLLGASAGYMAAPLLKMKPDLFIVLIPAIVCGVTALFLQKVMIVISTSAMGSWSVLAGVISFFSKTTPQLSEFTARIAKAVTLKDIVFIFIWLALAVAGASYQFSPAQKDTSPGGVKPKGDENGKKENS